MVSMSSELSVAHGRHLINLLVDQLES
jgi:hypothetical protein